MARGSRPVWQKGLLGLGIAAAWQIGAWALVGRSALEKRVAELAEIDLLYAENPDPFPHPLPHYLLLEATTRAPSALAAFSRWPP